MAQTRIKSGAFLLISILVGFVSSCKDFVTSPTNIVPNDSSFIQVVTIPNFGYETDTIFVEARTNAYSKSDVTVWLDKVMISVPMVTDSSISFLIPDGLEKRIGTLTIYVKDSLIASKSNFRVLKKGEEYIEISQYYVLPGDTIRARGAGFASSSLTASFGGRDILLKVLSDTSLYMVVPFNLSKKEYSLIVKNKIDVLLNTQIKRDYTELDSTKVTIERYDDEPFSFLLKNAAEDIERVVFKVDGTSYPILKRVRNADSSETFYCNPLTGGTVSIAFYSKDYIGYLRYRVVATSLNIKSAYNSKLIFQGFPNRVQPFDTLRLLFKNFPMKRYGKLTKIPLTVYTIEDVSAVLTFNTLSLKSSSQRYDPVNKLPWVRNDLVLEFIIPKDARTGAFSIAIDGAERDTILLSTSPVEVKLNDDRYLSATFKFENIPIVDSIHYYESYLNFYKIDTNYKQNSTFAINRNDTWNSLRKNGSSFSGAFYSAYANYSGSSNEDKGVDRVSLSIKLDTSMKTAEIKLIVSLYRFIQQYETQGSISRLTKFHEGVEYDSISLKFVPYSVQSDGSYVFALTGASLKNSLELYRFTRDYNAHYENGGIPYTEKETKANQLGSDFSKANFTFKISKF